MYREREREEERERERGRERERACTPHARARGSKLVSDRVSMSVCERESKGGSERKSERERERFSVCVRERETETGMWRGMMEERREGREKQIERQRSDITHMCIHRHMTTYTYIYTRTRRMHVCTHIQHTSTHCNTLQHTTTHGNTVQRTATQCNTLFFCCARQHRLSLFVSSRRFPAGHFRTSFL